VSHSSQRSLRAAFHANDSATPFLYIIPTALTDKSPKDAARCDEPCGAGHPRQQIEHKIIVDMSGTQHANPLQQCLGGLILNALTRCVQLASSKRAPQPICGAASFIINYLNQMSAR
jgi:hypothetical protein